MTTRECLEHANDAELDGRQDEQREWCERALESAKTDGDRAEGWLTLARCVQEPGRAAELAQKVLELYSGREDEAASLYHQGWAHLILMDSDAEHGREGLVLLEQALEAAPREDWRSQALARMAAIHLKLGELAEAADTAREGLAAALGRAERVACLVPMFTALIGMEWYDEAEERLDELEAEEWNPPFVDGQRGRVELETGRAAEAREHLERALASPGLEVEWQGVFLLALGQACFRLEDFDAAEQAFRRAQGLWPEEEERHWVAGALVARCRLALQDYEPARALAEAVLAGQGAPPGAWHAASDVVTEACDALGQQHHAAGRFPEATSMFRRILELHREPDEWRMQALVSLGGTLFERRKLGRAEICYRRVLGSEKATLEQTGAALLGLARVLAARGEAEEAVKFYREFLRTHKTDDEVRHTALFRLAQFQAGRQQWEEARRCYRELLLSPRLERDQHEKAQAALAALPAPEKKGWFR